MNNHQNPANHPYLCKGLYRALFIVIIFGLGSSCIANIVNTDVVYTSNNCSYQNQQIELISQDELNDIFAYGNKLVIPPISAPIIDSNSNIALIAMGSVKSLGYNIELLDINSQIMEQTLILPIKFNTPGRYELQGQILVSPCVVIKIDKGNYNSIAIY